VQVYKLKVESDFADYLPNLADYEESLAGR